MKFIKLQYFVIFISIILFQVKSFKLSSGLKSGKNKEKANSKSESSAKIEEKEENLQKVPMINVHLEEPDRHPIEVKRIEEERRIERNKIREMEAMEEMDKRTFQQIISLQNSQLSKLTSIADKTSQLLNRLTNNNSKFPTPPRFQQAFNKRKIKSLKYNNSSVSNGPVYLPYRNIF